MLLTCRSILGLYPFLKSPTGCEHEIPEEHTSTVAVAQPKDFKLNVARKCRKSTKRTTLHMGGGIIGMHIKEIWALSMFMVLLRTGMPSPFAFGV